MDFSIKFVLLMDDEMLLDAVVCLNAEACRSRRIRFYCVSSFCRLLQGSLLSIGCTPGFIFISYLQSSQCDHLPTPLKDSLVCFGNNFACVCVITSRHSELSVSVP